MGKLIIDGNEVYEIDEECMKKKEAEKKKRTAPEKGGQRYDTRKNPACRILRLRRVAKRQIPFRRSAIHAERFLLYRKCDAISYKVKKQTI